MNVQLGPKYASKDESTQCLKFFCEYLIQILTFFSSHSTHISVFSLNTGKYGPAYFCTEFLVTGWVFHGEEKETDLHYDSHAKVIQGIISFFDRQNIQKNNWSHSPSHLFSCHMPIASAIWCIFGMQVIIAMYKIIGPVILNGVNFTKIFKYKLKLRKKIAICFHTSQTWLN